mmetsp:Transcript_73185/g.169767  ORF Transcript_73185/g.169767 Transcript_73185/m.169767 type:complete len:252 (-) Transcript_73185:101-856(-)
MAAQLPSRVFLDVHEGATICPVLSEAPTALLEQMQRANCELLARENGDIVIYTPDGNNHGGYTIESFFKHFPQLYEILDMDTVDQFGPFLGEETVEILRQGAARGFVTPRAGVPDGVTRSPSDLGFADDPERQVTQVEEGESPRLESARTTGPQGDSMEDSFMTLKRALNDSCTKAELAIDSQHSQHQEDLRRLEADKQQLEAEKLELEKLRETLAEKESRLQKEMDEVDRLRAEIETSSAKSGKSRFLFC